MKIPQWKNPNRHYQISFTERLKRAKAHPDIKDVRIQKTSIGSFECIIETVHGDIVENMFPFEIKEYAKRFSYLAETLFEVTEDKISTIWIFKIALRSLSKKYDIYL